MCEENNEEYLENNEDHLENNKNRNDVQQAIDEYEFDDTDGITQED